MGETPADPPPLRGALIRMKLLRGHVECLTYRILYFTLQLQAQAITGIGGVNRDRAQHAGLTATKGPNPDIGGGKRESAPESSTWGRKT